jgi:hypothetical protein
VIHFNTDYMDHRDSGIDGAIGARFYF